MQKGSLVQPLKLHKTDLHLVVLIQGLYLAVEV